MATGSIRRLYLAHRRELQAFLTRKLRDADAAAELTQETFLRFAEFRHGHPAAVIAYERSYLYRTAHNLAIDHLRQRRRAPTEPASDHELAAIADDAPQAEQAVAGRDELAEVFKALLELPERTRQVFALTRIEGVTYREAAERLRISTSLVQKELARAVQHVMRRRRSGRR